MAPGTDSALPKGRERCLACGGYPHANARLTVPRAQSGDLIFCGYYCYRQWESRPATPDVD